MKCLLLFFILLVPILAKDTYEVNGKKAKFNRFIVKMKQENEASNARVNTLLKKSNLKFHRKCKKISKVAVIEITHKKGASEKEKKTTCLKLIKELLASGEFEFVEPDWEITLNQVNDVAFSDGTLWGLSNTGQNGGTAGIDVNVANSWNTVGGGDSNIVVGVIDTGILYTHQDLASNMWVNPGEIPNNGIDDDNNGYIDDIHGINAITGSGDPLDDNDHGTHCAGTIAASGNNSGPHIGVAYNVKLMGLKFLASDGSGATSDAIACIDYAVAKEADILSNSWGGGGFSSALEASIIAASNANIPFIAAAGNDSTNNDITPQYPANYDVENIISVAAIDRNGNLASFSNYGAGTVDIGAPGVDIYSSVSGSNTSYSQFSGTSMATPHVAGGVALLLSQDPSMTVSEIKQRLYSTATSISSLSGTVSSNGMMNIDDAMIATEDGILEVSLSSNPSPLRDDQSASLFINVSDLSPVSNASITATTQSGSIITFTNDGLGADLVANDGVYTADLPPQLGVTQFLLDIVVTAPGKTHYQGIHTLSILSAPANDDFANAISLNDGSTQASGTNVLASIEPGEPNPSPAGDNTVWWKWTSPTSDQITIDTIGSDYDTTLAIYSGIDGELSDLTLIGSNDDFSGLQSGITFTPAIGQNYFIQVSGYAGSTGNIVLNYPEGMQLIGPPVIIKDLEDTLTFSGSTLRLSVSVNGERPLTYQWFFGDTAIPGADSSVLTINDVSSTDAGNYYVTITNNLGNVQSSIITVQVTESLSTLEDGFDPDYNSLLWADFGGEVEANTNGQAAGAGSTGNSLWFGGSGSRFALTNPIDTSAIDNMSFKIALGSGGFPWETADSGEEVVLEYTTDGVSFIQIGDHYNNVEWVEYIVALPEEAKSSTTRFRFRQLSNSGASLDHWAIEDVSIPAVFSITSLLTDSLITNTPYTYQITTTAPASSFETTNLPLGLSLNTSNGEISGSISNVGVYPFTITAHNGVKSASAEFTLAVIEPLIVLEDDFDSDYDDNLWAEFGGEVEANTNGQAAGAGSTGNSLWFGGNGSRFALTNPVDTNNINNIVFKIALGSGSFPWETADSGDEVVLEYTTDGVNFTQIGDHYNNIEWVEYIVALPEEAKSNTTQFRFRQLSNFGTSYDHWAIEDVLISPPTDYFYDDWALDEIPDGSQRDVDLNYDNDTLPNVLEYALGLSPTDFNNSPFGFSNTSDGPLFSFDRPVGGVDGIQYVIEYSEDLDLWFEASPSEVITTPTSPDRETISFIPASSEQKMFMRLKIVLHD